MNWLETQFIYTTTTKILDKGLEGLFNAVDNALGAFWAPIQVSAAIYIALMGYALMSGMITMQPRDIAVRFLKVIGIILLVQIIYGFGNTLFAEFWKIPDAIADYFAKAVAPIINITELAGLPGMGSASVETLDGLATTYTGLASILGERVMDAHKESFKWGLGAWAAAMIPFIITVVAIYVAKFVTALLFLATPIVFILSLTMGDARGNAVLGSWFKALIMTVVTVIFVYIVGIACMAMMARYIAALLAADLLGVVISFLPGFDASFKYTLVHLAPIVIIGMLSIVLVSQATSVAGSLIGIAGVNTQQATSFMQIGALQAAGKIK